jgi:hypothetical protein
MNRDHQHKPDPDENTATIVAGSIAREAAKAPTGLEAAWREWSSHVQKVDDRTLSLLRAAFEAGFEAGSSSPKGATPGT